MQFPLVFNLFGSPLPAHLIFDVLSFFVAYRYFVILKKKRGTPIQSDQHEWYIFIGMAVGALIGSRLLAALEHPQLFFAPPSWLYYVVSKTIVGGILGGIIGVEIAKKIYNVRRRTGNIFVYPLMLAIAIGRIGCFLTGISDGTAGKSSSLPWAMDQGDGIPRHPTALYEIALIVLLWLALRWYEKHTAVKDGSLFVFFVMGYCIFRFFVEFIKPTESLTLGLSSIQLACLCAVIYYGIRTCNEERRPASAPTYGASIR
jgi:phosphatidylglycerol---prolipoprotein diacylglyceryl transferase